jgi:chromosome partitioning protein
MSRVLAIANQKGGVGKTTTAINLGAALADDGTRVLLIDLDPQCNTTITLLGVGADERARTMYEALADGVPLRDVIVPVDGSLALGPASRDLLGIERKIGDEPGRDLLLRDLLAELDDRYDVVLLDCPPSLGLLTVNALAAATDVLVPIECQEYSYLGFAQLIDTVGVVRKRLNKTLRIAGVVVNRYDRTSPLQRQWLDHLQRELTGHHRLFETIIPQSKRVPRAAQARQSVVQHDPVSTIAAAYRTLAQEVSCG